MEGSDWSTYDGTVKDPALDGAMHSTRTPGVVSEGTPDWLVEAIAVMLTNPLGSPPVQVIFRS